MLSILFAVIATLVVVAILVGVHEYGHFITARHFKVKVLRFSLGFGPIIFRKKDKHDTEFALSLIPLGGYVKMLDERESFVSEEDLPYSFTQKPIWQRFLIILAGPLFNIIFAILAYWLLFSLGVTRIAPNVDVVLANTPAAQAGMVAHEKIISIDGEQVDEWGTIAIRIIFRLGDDGLMRIKTDKKTYSLDLKDWQVDPIKPDPLRDLGLLPRLQPEESVQYVKLQSLPWQAWRPALTYVGLYSQLNLIIFQKIITGKISPRTLGGPISLFVNADLALQSGFKRFLEFLAVISVIIGIVNLFPYPGLDGGHLIYLIIEAVTGKPVSTAIQLLAFRLGMILLALLLIQVTINDILRYL